MPLYSLLAKYQMFSRANAAIRPAARSGPASEDASAGTRTRVTSGLKAGL